MFRIAAVLAAVAVLVTVAAAGTLLSLGGVDFLRNSRVIAVPADLKPVILEAAQRCPVVPASVLAAQLASESSWDPRAVSPAGASGIAQFMPEVWDQYAVDGDGDGIIDIWNPVDAIHSAAELNCVNATLVADVDAGGKLLVTSARLILVAGGVKTWPWHQVAEVTRADRDLLVTLRGLPPVRLRMNSYEHALVACALTQRLIAARTTGPRDEDGPS